MPETLNSTIALRLISDSNARIIQHAQARNDMERRVADALRTRVPPEVVIQCVEAVRAMYAPAIEHEKNLQTVLKAVYIP